MQDPLFDPFCPISSVVVALLPAVTCKFANGVDVPNPARPETTMPFVGGVTAE